MNSVMIEIKGLKKYYDKHKVIDIESFKFYDKCKYLLIGENGIGKSTLIKMIIGVIKPSEGKIELYSKRIGFVPEKVFLPEFIRVDTFLKMINKNYDDKYLDLLDLDKRKMIYKLSKGNRQKLTIVQALIEDNDILIFDEPLNGLDRKCKESLFKILKEMNKLIIIASHYPNEFPKDDFIFLHLKDGMIYV